MHGASSKVDTRAGWYRLATRPRYNAVRPFITGRRYPGRSCSMTWRWCLPAGKPTGSASIAHARCRLVSLNVKWESWFNHSEWCHRGEGDYLLGLLIHYDALFFTAFQWGDARYFLLQCLRWPRLSFYCMISPPRRYFDDACEEHLRTARKNKNMRAKLQIISAYGSTFGYAPRKFHLGQGSISKCSEDWRHLRHLAYRNSPRRLNTYQRRRFDTLRFIFISQVVGSDMLVTDDASRRYDTHCFALILRIGTLMVTCRDARLMLIFNANTRRNRA